MSERSLIRTMINRNQENTVQRVQPVQSPASNEDFWKKQKIDTFNYMTAGNATFTVESTKIDKRYTFKVMHRKNDKVPSRYIVKVLHGQDNDNDYHYLGLFYADTGNGVWNEANDAQRMFSSLLRMLLRDDVPWWSTCHFYKSGRCACCGRTLTVPESIETGIGPECIKRYTNHY